VLLGGTAIAGGLTLPRIAAAFPASKGEELIHWLDPPGPYEDPTLTTLLNWELFDSWITPNEKFFVAFHYDAPAIDESAHVLEIGGLVSKPMRMTMEQIKKRPKKELIFTLECSGNDGFQWFSGGVGNAKWTGTPLLPLLKEAGIKPEGIDVAFYGHDRGPETIHDVKVQPNFARSMSVKDATDPNLLLCWEMNGAPLSKEHGFPLRLIAPGWYGIANVKWLERIEVIDTRLMNRFMGRDYVTLREEKRSDKTVFTESSVGRQRLKSQPAKVTRIGDDCRIYGAAWGAPIKAVEVRIDQGPWQTAQLDQSKKEQSPFAWRIWTLDWPKAPKGEHTIASRAIDTKGRLQPAMDDPLIAGKKTYWESNGQITRKIKIA
jgi:DMSO/TMAO reductase YedYZ molybdopterin-dependent catalytic subunit